MRPFAGYDSSALVDRAGSCLLISSSRANATAAVIGTNCVAQAYPIENRTPRDAAAGLGVVGAPAVDDVI